MELGGAGVRVIAQLCNWEEKPRTRALQRWRALSERLGRGTWSRTQMREILLLETLLAPQGGASGLRGLLTWPWVSAMFALGTAGPRLPWRPHLLTCLCFTNLTMKDTDS